MAKEKKEKDAFTKQLEKDIKSPAFGSKADSQIKKVAVKLKLKKFKPKDVLTDTEREKIKIDAAREKARQEKWARIDRSRSLHRGLRNG